MGGGLFGSASNQLTYHPLFDSGRTFGCTWSLPLPLSASARFLDGSDDHCAQADDTSIRTKAITIAYRIAYRINPPKSQCLTLAIKAETRPYSGRTRRSMLNRWNRLSSVGDGKLRNLPAARS